MTKRKSNPTAAAETAAQADTAIETVTAEVAAETDNSDDAVLAALAAADEVESPFSGPVETADVVVETAEDVTVELEAEDEDAVLAALADSDDSAAPATTKTKAKRAAAAPKAPVVTREFCDVADHMDAAKLKAALDGIEAKKVAEKANNVVQAITSGKKLSGYTKLGVKTLLDKGRITSKDLVEMFQANNMSLGTARAQAQQQTALFKALGIAVPDVANPRELVAADNGLVKELAALAA